MLVHVSLARERLSSADSALAHSHEQVATAANPFHFEDSY